MLCLIRDHVTRVCDKSDEKGTWYLCCDKETGSDGTKEAEESIHGQVDEYQNDKVGKPTSGVQVKVHQEIRTDLIYKHYSCIV